MATAANFNTYLSPQTILVAPLDWGLGHATRCIPLIYSFLQKGNRVIIAASGSGKQLLKEEFPGLEILDIPAYNISYSKHPFWLPVKILWQLPAVFSAIKKENSWLKRIVEDKKIDMVVSDNRPGLYHHRVKCIYITHQLTIKSSFDFLQWLMQKMHYKYINRFNESWVPDYEGNNNLAGELSHPEKKPAIPVTYIGPLTRFSFWEEKIKYKLIIVLSGPEPQRTILENKLINELKNVNEPVLFVRGIYSNEELRSFNNIEFKNILTSKELNKAILESETVICRSGYSSIMDLASLNKKATLIPTPGQTEQQYLAEYLNGRGLFKMMKQEDICFL